MITGNQFDNAFDCQKVFKAMMNALAQPGKVFPFAGSATKIPTGQPALTAAALTLLEHFRSFYVEWNPALAEELHEQTYGQLASLSQADYLFYPRMDGAVDIPGVLQQVKPGTLAEPHKSATLLVLLPSFTGGKALTLKGPGIDGAITVHLPECGRRWILERQKIGFEFPCGVDLFFFTPEGEVMGLPRKILAEEGGQHGICSSNRRPGGH